MPDTPESLEAFFDGVIGAQIAEGNVVGATLALVENGRVVVSRGYGLADREGKRSVTPDASLFRIGSVSKPFVWVAVMQQVTAGKLDLHADVNDYLEDFEIPATYPVPITLMHLMTHTPGFEDRVEGLFARGPRTVGGLHQNLVRMLPARVMMPGEDAAYSNYGAALAAHLVEIVSGESWDDYLDRHILDPLGMTHSTGRQPVEKPLDEQVATGYRFENGRFEATPFEFVTLPPAGSISTTADDMAKFLLELLAENDGSVMTAPARRQLFQAGFHGDQRLNGMLHGLYEQSSHGARMMGHGGDTMVFHSMLRLYPERRMGIFVSFNADKGAKARGVVLAAFEDRLFGVPVPPHRSAGSAEFAQYAGSYRSLRVPAHGPTKLMALLSTIRVSADTDGGLRIPDAFGGTERYVPTDGDGLFAAEDGRSRMAFSSSDGRATRLYFDAIPFIGYVRAARRDEPWVHQLLLAASTLTLVLVVIWPWSTLRRRGRTAVRGETTATAFAVIVTVILLGLLIGLASQVADANDVVFGLSEYFRALLWLPVVVAPLLLALLVQTYRAWVAAFWWITRRIHYTFVTIAAFVLVAWFFYWELVAIPVPFS